MEEDIWTFIKKEKKKKRGGGGKEMGKKVK